MDARVYVARHGRTAWNRERRRLGRHDEPLDEVGLEQAEQLRLTLRARPIGRIVSSPLVRARDTAAVIGRDRSIDVVVDPDLIEFDFGVYEGTGRDVKVKLRRDFRDVPVEHGESLRDAWVRSQRAADRIRLLAAESDGVLVVGHSRLNKLLIGSLCSTSFDEALDADLELDTGSAIELAAEPELAGGRFRIVGAVLPTETGHEPHR